MLFTGYAVCLGRLPLFRLCNKESHSQNNIRRFPAAPQYRSGLGDRQILPAQYKQYLPEYKFQKSFPPGL